MRVRSKGGRREPVNTAAARGGPTTNRPDSRVCPHTQDARRWRQRLAVAHECTADGRATVRTVGVGGGGGGSYDSCATADGGGAGGGCQRRAVEGGTRRWRQPRRAVEAALPGGDRPPRACLGYGRPVRLGWRFEHKQQACVRARQWRGRECMAVEASRRSSSSVRTSKTSRWLGRRA